MNNQVQRKEKPKSYVVIRMEFKDAAKAMITTCGQSQLLRVLSDIIEKQEQVALTKRIRSIYNKSVM